MLQGMVARAAAMLREARGVVAIEFALAGPLFLLMVCVTLQVSLQLLVQLTLDYGIDAAARQVQIGNIRDADGNARAEFKAVVCGYVVSFSDSCSTLLQSYAASGAVFAALPRAVVSTSGTLVPSTFSVGTAGSSVLIQVGYQVPDLVPWVGRVTGVGSGTSMAVATMQNEPY